MSEAIKSWAISQENTNRIQPDNRVRDSLQNCGY